MDGMTDLILRARGAAVMDIGCNRGLVGFEFANNGAAIVHGCDIYPEGIRTARELFVDLQSVKSQFEVVDLTRGPEAFKLFGEQRYTITLMLATVHKLKRVMPPEKLTELIQHIASRTSRYFAWRATSDKPDENEQEMLNLDRDLESRGLRRIQTSTISEELGIAAIWSR